MRLKRLTFLLVISAAVLALIGGPGGARPAHATIHEGPIASWCALLAYSGRIDILNPPGLTGQGSEQSFARPILASGMVTVTAPYDHDGDGTPDGVLITPNTDHPAVKVTLTGDIFEVEPGVFIAFFVPDPDFAAFERCRNFDSHAPGPHD
jgi:hypothetical protein